MKKSVKRVLCAALVCLLSWTLAAGQLLRFYADGAAGTNVSAVAAFENVSGQFDTSALREQNFNAQVLKARNATTVSDSQDEQDASNLERNEFKRQVWAAQPYSAYYNEKYLLPMGGYVYRLDENEEKMYTQEEYCAVSRYNEYDPDDEKSSYMTSTGIKSLGLLRNASIVKYKLYDAQTGEFILEDSINGGGKEDSGGGTPTPANVELEFFPEEYALAANGLYRMEFEFFTDTPEADESAAEENTFSFSFTVDYEAPILEDVRVRYYDYKDGTKEKQKIYLDVDVYDNHYAQAIMLCYPKKTVNSQTGEGETVLQLATEYPTPVRNAVKNGTTTVSIDITDIYEEYGKQLYLQIDDYALNGCLYQVDIAQANAAQTPDAGFTLASGEENITLGIYETHKVSLKNIGNANLSNFVWSSGNPTVANVKNGEIVGLKAGETTIFVSDPDKDPNKVRQIHVTVTDEHTGTLVSVPTLSFGVIKTSREALQKATGVVKVSAGQEIALSIQTDPWYHPMTGLSFKWSSTDESVATVDQNGVVHTLKKGTAIIGATVLRGGVETRYFANVTLRVQEEFDVSNFTLNDYNGVGYNERSVKDGKDILVIPTDMNIMYIGEDAFKDNDNVRRIVIPASVVEIRESAFENCKALEEVYFVSEKPRQTEGSPDDISIDFSDLSLVHRRAFHNCKALKKVDLSNVKTITLDQEAFLNCQSLETIVDMPSVGTAYDRAFKNCTSLTSVDLSRLHVSGENVFENCVSLNGVTTDTSTAIGKNMFVGCTGLREEITLYAAKVGEGAFSGCVNLKGVRFEASEIEIGARAFENCGSGLTDNEFEIDWNGKTVRSIGDRAFKGAKLAAENETFLLPDGLLVIGANLFDGCQTVKTVALGNTDLDGAKLLGAAFRGLNVTVTAGSTKLAEENGVIYAVENGVKNKIVYVNDGVAGTLDLSASGVTEIGEYAFAGTVGINEVILPTSLTVIGEGAFADSAIEKIRFNGAAITEIPARAFAGAKIENIELPASVTRLGAYAFMGSALKSLVTENGSALAGIVGVGDYAFAASEVFSICFEDGEQNAEFGNGVFAGAKRLESAILPSLSALGYSTFEGATSLKTVVFGVRSTATGDYTFTGTAIEKAVYSDSEPSEVGVTLREGQTVWGDGLFYNASLLTEIELAPSVIEIGDYALFGATKLARANLENVVKIGDYAFYDSALETLDLASAKSIGAFAFFNGGETVVALSQSVKEIGVGAFASSNKLTAITFATQTDEIVTTNGTFFVENNVLYRCLDEAKTQFAVMCYPAALPGTTLGDSVQTFNETQKRSYKIKEGTVRVEAYAFYGLQKGALDKIILPYSVKAIGNAAFYASGVKEYTFESIQAPVLETAYRADIENAIEELATASTVAFYKGYYYSNFQTDIYNYTHYVGKTSDLKINYPTNGKGYDTYIYRLYFGVKAKTGVMMTDETRACLNLLNGLTGAGEVATWLNWNAEDVSKKAIVEAFSAQVKAARASYNNVLKDEAQAAFLGEEYGEKLLAIEEQLRAVKVHFNIPVYVSNVATANESGHQATYTEGEKFDWTGLVITVTYDDGSTKEFTPESGLLTLKDEGVALTKYDSYVIVEYTENNKTKSAYVVITVNERELSSIEKYPEEANVMRNVLIYGGAAMMLVGGLGVLVMFAINKRKVAKAAMAASRIEPFDTNDNVEVATTDADKPQE